MYGSSFSFHSDSYIYFNVPDDILLSLSRFAEGLNVPALPPLSVCKTSLFLFKFSLSTESKAFRDNSAVEPYLAKPVQYYLIKFSEGGQAKVEAGKFLGMECPSLKKS